MKTTYTTLLSLLSLLSITLLSCGDDSTIGSTIVQDKVIVSIDSSFTVTGRTVDIEKVQSRTTSQLIGRIDARGYGRLSSEIVTQFMPALQLDTEKIRPENIDSLMLVMKVANGEFVGDSVAPLGIEIYPLTKPLPSPIYSNFDPEGYYDPHRLLATKMYNVANNSAPKYYTDGYRRITVKLPTELGQELYNKYVADPQSFGTPQAFAEVFPGLYIKNSFGSGRVTRITNTMMEMHYHYTYHNDETGRDSVISKTGNYFAVTPEIVTNNNISMEVSPSIDALIAEGQHLVLAPVGKKLEIRFPAPEIIAAYKAAASDVKVLNSLTFSVPGTRIANDYNLPMPTYLLLVLKSKEAEFFAKNTLPDNATSFYATLNTSTGQYNFGEMRQYILDLLAKDSISEDDYTFTITPVSATFETSGSSYYYGSTSTLSLLAPYVASPVMARLDLDKAKVKLTFSSQSIDY